MSFLPTLLSGSIFGAALTGSQVFRTDVILNQFRLTDMHMAKVFLTASGCSTLVLYSAKRLGLAQLPPRENASMRVLGTYDANLLGGLLQGLGMALCGACPGTVLVQVAQGHMQGLKILAGGLLGGMAYVFAVDKSCPPQSDNVKHTIYERMQVKEETAILTYELMLVGVVGTLNILNIGVSGTQYQHSALIGGAFLGAAQAASVILTKKTLGISSAFAQLAGNVLNTISGNKRPTAWTNIIFAIGVILGARLIGAQLPSHATDIAHISTTAAIAGGMCSIFGARLASGCTSGHALSGMSLFSVSSIVTAAAMFGGGIIFRHILDVF